MLVSIHNETEGGVSIRILDNGIGISSVELYWIAQQPTKIYLMSHDVEHATMAMKLLN